MTDRTKVLVTSAACLLLVAMIALAQTANNNIQSQPVAITNAGQAGTIAAVKASAAPVATDGAVAVALSPNNAGAVTLANSPTSQTLTARNLFGGIVTEKSSRWAVFSQPAVSTQATASIAAEAGVRHVADCVSFSGGSTTAPALTLLTVNLRDGATGAGTVLWTHSVVVTAAVGQNVAPFTACGLNLVGTTNTAMTLEFSALLTNLFEAASISGYNVN